MYACRVCNHVVCECGFIDDIATIRYGTSDMRAVGVAFYERRRTKSKERNKERKEEKGVEERV